MKNIFVKFLYAALLFPALAQSQDSLVVYPYYYTNYIYTDQPRPDYDKSTMNSIKWVGRGWYFYEQNQQPVSRDTFYLYCMGNKVWESKQFSKSVKVSANNLIINDETIAARTIILKDDAVYYNPKQIAFSYREPIQREAVMSFWEDNAPFDALVNLQYQGWRYMRNAKGQLARYELFMHEWTKCINATDETWKLMCETYLDKKTGLPARKVFWAYWCYADTDRTAMLMEYLRGEPIRIDF